MLVVLLNPFVRCRHLLALNGCDGRRVTHGVLGGQMLLQVKRAGQLRADGSQRSLIGLGEVCHEF
jgi:hypothetical protein